jgi:hypothetical protein
VIYRDYENMPFKLCSNLALQQRKFFNEAFQQKRTSNEELARKSADDSPKKTKLTLISTYEAKYVPP